MLFPETMEVVELIAPADEVDSVVDALATGGFLHFYSKQNQNVPIELKEKANLVLSKAIQFKGRDVTKTYEELSSWDDALDNYLEKLTQYEYEKKKLESALSSLTDQEKKMTEAMSSLRYFPDDFDFNAFASLGEGFGSAVFLFKERIPEFPCPSLVLSSSAEGFTSLLIFQKDLQKKVMGIALKQGGIELEYPAWLNPNAKKAKEEAEKEISSIQAQKEALLPKLSDLNEEAYPLAARAAEVSTFLLQSLEVRSGEEFTSRTRLLTGFVPKRSLDRVLDITKQFPDVIAFHHQASQKDKPPTLEKLPNLVRAFNVIVGSLGLPDYSEVDPTLITAITFPLLFAIMFPDAGQALILLIAGVFFAKRAKGALKDLGIIIAFSGAAAVVSGLLFGEFFGLEIHPLAFHIFEWVNSYPFAGTPFSVWHPSSIVSSSTSGYVIRLMIFAMAVGITQMTSGFILSGVNHLKKGESFHALSSDIPKAILLPSAFVLIVEKVGFSDFGAFLWVGLVILPFLLIYASPFFASSFGIKGYVVEGLMEAVESTISFISNTFSYLRLLAMAVAHLALMLVIFVVAWMALGFFGGSYLGWAMFWLVVALGNFVVMIFEALLVFIQSMRLHFYEWMMKFFTGTGYPYSPLSYDGKTIKVVINRAQKRPVLMVST
ncbi:MAG: V-type ATP synthase subunit I [Thermoprotei archaeon]